MCWTVKFKLSILVDWKAPILAYKVPLSIGIIEVIVAITRKQLHNDSIDEIENASEIGHESALCGDKTLNKYTR